MRSNNIFLLSGILGLAVFGAGMYPAPGFADVLVIPDVITSTDLAELPQNGLSMTQVQQQHGEALVEHATVGEPPITRWDYAGFSVFFEYDRVITAVQKPASAVKENKQ